MTKLANPSKAATITFKSCWDTCSFRLKVDHYSLLHTITLPTSPPPPPQSMLLKPKHIKSDEKWHTTLNRGRGRIDVC